MIGKIISVIIVLAMLIFSLGFMYQNLPQEPVEMKMGKVAFKPVVIIDYGATPVFMENLRFNHNNISYFIEDTCVKVQRDAMIEAFDIFTKEMRLISFYEIEDEDEADIGIGCLDNYIKLDERLFAAGEGGPSRIINTSVFRTIEKGKILLYDNPRCDYPVVELHELLHVFGFDHSTDPSNIMYNISGCEQRISEDMVKLIYELYSIEALADAVISELTAIKRGRYLDFNISVLNEGLVGIDEINLTIIADGKEVHEVDLGDIDIGYGLNLRATNVKLPSRNVEVILFIVDSDNVVRELNEDNNFVEMVVGD